MLNLFNRTLYGSCLLILIPRTNRVRRGGSAPDHLVDHLVDLLRDLLLNLLYNLLEDLLHDLHKR